MNILRRLWEDKAFTRQNHEHTGNKIQKIIVDFDDSYITDREAELERKRNDALAFDIPKLTIWYLMEAYSLTEKEATKLVKEKIQEEEEQPVGEDED